MLTHALTLAFLATALGQAPTQPRVTNQTRTEAPELRKIDGQWQVTYIEMDGKKIENKDFADVTIRGNTLTCKHDGKEMSWKLEFGPNQQVRAEQTSATKSTTGAVDAQGAPGEKRSHGVYIAAKDYLCFSMCKGQDPTGGTGRPGGATTTQPGVANQASNEEIRGSHFVLILHRQSTTSTNR